MAESLKPGCGLYEILVRVVLLLVVLGMARNLLWGLFIPNCLSFQVIFKEESRLDIPYCKI